MVSKLPLLVASISMLSCLTACSANKFLGIKEMPTSTTTTKIPVAKIEGTVSPEMKMVATTVYAQNLAVSENISTNADNQLVLKPALFNGSSTGNSGYDAGMNALKTGQTSNKTFSGVKGFNSRDDGKQLYLRDPAAAGFKYQSFGQVFAGAHSQGYVSVGKRFTPADTATVKATYKGGAMGTYDGASEVISDMTATLNWGADAKTLDVVTTNSQISIDNIKHGEYIPVSKDSRFDMNEKLTWDTNRAAFVTADESMIGFLYGNNAAEVGGTFVKKIDGKDFEGAYGGVKQP